MMEMRPVSHFWGFEVIWVWGIHIPICGKGEAKTDSDLIKTHKHVSWRSVHHNLRLPSNLISSLVLVHDVGAKCSREVCKVPHFCRGGVPLSAAPYCLTLLSGQLCSLPGTPLPFRTLFLEAFPNRCLFLYS